MEVDLSITYVYVINSDIKMSKGKITAQVSHCAMLLHDAYPDLPLGRALIFKASYAELLLISQSTTCVYQNDAGFNQVPIGVLTCIAFVQRPDNLYITKGRKLY